MDSYKDQNVDRYRYLASLERRTCSKCAGLDYRIFKTDDAIEGSNYPLIHPHCRCTTTPYFKGIDELTSGKRWLKNPLTGEKELVDSMNVKESKQWVQVSSQGKEAKAAYSRCQQVAHDKTADSGQRDTAKKLLSGEWTSKINNEKQAPHMESTHQKGKSYFADNVDVQSLVYKYAGTGKRNKTVSNELKNTETIEVPGLNGLLISKQGSFDIDGIKIYYSKERLHIVPWRDTNNKK